MNNKNPKKKKVGKGYIYILTIIGIIILGLIYIGFNQVQKYKTNNNKCQQENTILNSKLVTLTAVNKELQNSTSTDGLNQQINELNATLATLNEQKAALTKEINTLNSQKATKTNEIANLETRLQNIQADFAAHSPKIATLQAALATYKADSTTLLNYITSASYAYISKDEAKLLEIGEKVLAMIPELNKQINNINTLISGLE
ncbi:MAG TPA: hypothetical protein PK737_03450 [Bacilli bacterium]|mgnify:CR=1 FL=1|nr:hypothetical protein [Bacilli bacterium]